MGVFDGHSAEGEHRKRRLRRGLPGYAACFGERFQPRSAKGLRAGKHFFKDRCEERERCARGACRLDFSDAVTGDADWRRNRRILALVTPNL